MLEKVQTNPQGLNQPQTWLADAGYYGEKNSTRRMSAAINPLLAVNRDEHHQGWRDCFSEPVPLAEDAMPVEVITEDMDRACGSGEPTCRSESRIGKA